MFVWKGKCELLVKTAWEKVFKKLLINEVHTAKLKAESNLIVDIWYFSLQWSHSRIKGPDAFKYCFSNDLVFCEENSYKFPSSGYT